MKEALSWSETSAFFIVTAVKTSNLKRINIFRYFPFGVDEQLYALGTQAYTSSRLYVIWCVVRH
jgi:hypothetical protein